MKFSCTVNNLKKGIAMVNHIVGKNITLPILNNILITTKGSSIELMSTNLEVAIQTTIRGKVITEGSATIPARLISEYVAHINAETITLETVDNNITITTPQGTTTVKGMDPAEYPLLPDIETQTAINIQTTAFTKAIKQVLFAASHDTTRPELASVLVRIREGKMYLVATDSYRLAEKKLALPQAGDCTLLVPQTTMQEIQRLFGDDTESDSVLLEISDTQIKCSTEHTLLLSRISEGQYPDYEQIVPQTFLVSAEVPVAELAKTVRAASIFCRQGINDVRLHFSQDYVQISAVNDQVGQSELRLTASIQGGEGSIVVNYHYILDMLSVVDETEIELQITDNNAPMKCLPKGRIDYIYIIMPIRQ